MIQHLSKTFTGRHCFSCRSHETRTYCKNFTFLSLAGSWRWTYLQWITLSVLSLNHVRRFVWFVSSISRSLAICIYNVVSISCIIGQTQNIHDIITCNTNTVCNNTQWEMRHKYPMRNTIQILYVIPNEKCNTNTVSNTLWEVQYKYPMRNAI